MSPMLEIKISPAAIDQNYALAIQAHFHEALTHYLKALTMLKNCTWSHAKISQCQTSTHPTIFSC